MQLLHQSVDDSAQLFVDDSAQKLIDFDKSCRSVWRAHLFCFFTRFFSAHEHAMSMPFFRSSNRLRLGIQQRNMGMTIFMLIT